jgi:hypothetical protein
MVLLVEFRFKGGKPLGSEEVKGLGSEHWYESR